jgi:hypothetical protein
MSPPKFAGRSARPGHHDHTRPWIVTSGQRGGLEGRQALEQRQRFEEQPRGPAARQISPGTAFLNFDGEIAGDPVGSHRGPAWTLAIVAPGRRPDEGCHLARHLVRMAIASISTFAAG